MSLRTSRELFLSPMLLSSQTLEPSSLPYLQFLTCKEGCLASDFVDLSKRRYLTVVFSARLRIYLVTVNESDRKRKGSLTLEQQ